MATYTVTHEFIENTIGKKKYIANILFAFIQDDNPHKVARDKKNIICDLYTSICSKAEYLAHWLSLMSLEPTNFEDVEVDLTAHHDLEILFLTLCKATVGHQKMIVYSHQNWNKHKYINQNHIEFLETHIEVFERDEIYQEFMTQDNGGITAYGSIIAQGNSQIDKSKIG